MDQNQELRFDVEPPVQPKKAPRNRAIASMIFGILSIHYIGSFPGLLFSIISLILAKGIRRKHPESTASGFATAGLVTGWVGLGFGIQQLLLLCAVLIFYVLYFVFVIVMAFLSEAALVGGMLI